LNNDLQNEQNGGFASNHYAYFNDNRMNTEIQAQLAINQMCYRHLFGEFLKLISLVLKMPQTCDSLKLLNEVLVCNETWQETVKNFSISMWLQDVVSPVIIAFHWKYGSSQKSSGIDYLSLD
jgi:hypothetical protein